MLGTSGAVSALWGGRPAWWCRRHCLIPPRLLWCGSLSRRGPYLAHGCGRKPILSGARGEFFFATLFFFFWQTFWWYFLQVFLHRAQESLYKTKVEAGSYRLVYDCALSVIITCNLLTWLLFIRPSCEVFGWSAPAHGRWPCWVTEVALFKAHFSCAWLFVGSTVSVFSSVTSIGMLYFLFCCFGLVDLCVFFFSASLLLMA